MSTEPNVTTEALYLEYWGFIYRLLPTYGVFGPDQDDVAQTVWQNIHTQIDTYDPTRQPPRAWITGFVRRCAANYRRDRRNHPETPCAEPAAAMAAPGLTPEQYTLLRTLEQVIVDVRHREAFLLQAQHGLTVPEIADVMETSESQIAWWLLCVRRTLRASRGRRFA